MKNQRGVTLGGVIFFMILVGFAAYAAARILPAYSDYWVVKKVITNMVGQPDILDWKDRDIYTKFDREMSLNNITTISSSDLVIDRKQNGITLSTDFSTKKPFMGPVGLCMDFHAEAKSN